MSATIKRAMTAEIERLRRHLFLIIVTHEHSLQPMPAGLHGHVSEEAFRAMQAELLAERIRSAREDLEHRTWLFSATLRDVIGQTNPTAAAPRAHERDRATGASAAPAGASPCEREAKS